MAKEHKTEKFSSYVVITDREPWWDDKPQPKNAIISGRRDDEGIMAMLERGWIEEVPRHD